MPPTVAVPRLALPETVVAPFIVARPVVVEFPLIVVPVDVIEVLLIEGAESETVMLFPLALTAVLIPFFPTILIVGEVMLPLVLLSPVVLIVTGVLALTYTST